MEIFELLMSEMALFVLGMCHASLSVHVQHGYGTDFEISLLLRTMRLAKIRLIMPHDPIARYTKT